MSKKVYIETFGCQMNDHDSDRIARSLIANSYEIVSDEALADAVILNTCSIRDKAEKKVFSKIGRLASLKRNGKEMVLGVAGCMAQRLGKKFMDDYREVDLVFGTHVIPGAAYFLDRAFEGKRVIDVSQKGVGEFEFLSLPEDKYTYSENVTANVTIMNGCNNYCSYCVVPYVRGPEVSRSPREIIEEIKRLAERGVKEVTLLGQNVNSYGNGTDSDYDFDCDFDSDHDRNHNRNHNQNHNQNRNYDPNFVKLLREVSKIEGLERIRFVTSHPKDLNDELINLFGKLPELCEHIHLPVQSGSDKVLERMNRKYTSSDYRELVRKLKNACPGIAITTDIIVGYPGEDDEDFKKTLRLVEGIGFDSSFSFRYSPRPGTQACTLSPMIDEDVASARLGALQNLQKDITFRINKGLVGSIQEVLVEGKSKRRGNEYFGRTRTNKIVNFKSDCNNTGKLLNLKITKANKNSLFGEL